MRFSHPQIVPGTHVDLYSRVAVLAAPQIADQLGMTRPIPDHSVGICCC